MAFTGEFFRFSLHAIVTMGFLWWMWFKVYQPRKLEPATPSELTTCGILGTFTGIFLGLCPFALPGGTDISKNIPGLIAGIGVATICSMFGMFLALLSKGKQRIARMSEEANGEDQHNGATADTLANLLQELLQQSKTQNDNLSALQKSIAGNEDGTLLTQMQKLRTSVADKQDKLIESFDSFAEKMAKNNSEALIDALKEVIKDFNTKINEQFGENFKHLNEAVGRLLEWQENYRIEIAELQRQFKLCAEGIVSSEAALSSITEKSQAMVEAANRLEQLLVAYDSYRSRLLDNMEAFASLSREAQDAFPVIQKNLKELTEGFSSAVQTSTSEIEQTVNKTSRLLEDSVQRSTAGVEETLRKTEERIKEQLENLDIALEDQLTKSLSSLGNQLVSLSGKFVSDYTPLTTELQKLVRAASNGNNN